MMIFHLTQLISSSFVCNVELNACNSSFRSDLSSQNIFQLQDSCLADCKFLLVKTQFCRTFLCYLHNFENFSRDICLTEYFVSQNEILLVLTNRPQGFVKTDRQQFILSYILKMNYFLNKTIQIQNKAAFHLTQLLSSCFVASITNTTPFTQVCHLTICIMQEDHAVGRFKFLLIMSTKTSRLIDLLI